MAVIETLDCTEKHTLHLTLEASVPFSARIMFGVGMYPSVFPERCDPDSPSSQGGRKTVDLAKGVQTVDIPVGLNYFDGWLASGETTNPLVQVLYIENAATGDAVMDDTEVDEMVKVKKP